jgi:hypothetical protein
MDSIIPIPPLWLIYFILALIIIAGIITFILWGLCDNGFDKIKQMFHL